jgi:phage-related protein (TIGR01555 family)
MKKKEDNKTILDKAKSFIKDAFYNSFNGFGSSSDPFVNTVFEAETVPTKYDLENLYRFNWLARRIVETPVKDALREGFTCNLENEDENALKNRLKELGVFKQLFEVNYKARLYGQAFLLIGARDGSESLAEPLNKDNIKSLDFFRVVDRYEVNPIRFYTDADTGNFGKVELYSFNPITNSPNTILYIHESRLIPFYGNMLGTNNALANNNFGESVLTVLQKDLKAYSTSIHASAQVIQDFVSKVWKIPDLTSYLENPDVFEKRMQLNLKTSSNFSGTVLAEGEEMQKIATPIGGLADLVSMHTTNIAAAAGIMKTKLFGEALGQLSGAEASRKNYFDDIRGYQKNELQKPIEAIINMVLLDKTFNLSPDTEFVLEFNPIDQPTQKEELEMRKINAETYKIDIESGVLSPSEVAESTYGGEEYSYERKIDMENRELIDMPIEEEEKPSSEDE